MKTYDPRYLRDPELDFYRNDLINQENNNRRYVSAFSRNRGSRLLRIDGTIEEGRPELMYFFDDKLGGYTLAGIINSLIENPSDL